MAPSMRLARVSVKVQGVALCLLLLCLLQNTVVHSSENALSAPVEQERDDVMENVEPAPIEQTEGLHLEARMALPDPEPRAPHVEKDQMIGVLVNKEGALVPVYPTNRSALTKSKRYQLHLLDISLMSATVSFGNGSYPDHYPKDRILKALHKAGAGYENVFAKVIDLGKLRERIDSPNDGYMCSSALTHAYPTYDPVTDVYIVNVEGFYQGISFDVCNEVGALCSKTCHTEAERFVCDQNYGTMEVVIAREKRKGGDMELSLARMSYPSSCKCRRL
ncbi:uncharacterized protein LOC125955982 [Anopheles darlingi]|uniref:uncharacterized protein LOC125955982 n=1 Tax=Anopheles darlingi TaxID=43151 RepID=UPI0021002A63|nr:uncharacterized protein LOC125955982 [Anopheles darlingi]